MTTKIPVTIVSGFLGAGKTTLLNKVLKEQHNEHIAVIINEFGEISVDHQFVLDVQEEIYQMENGCLCCTLRNDIADMLQSILEVKERNGVKVDRILFETTGLADPAPIAQTFINIPFLNENFIVDAVLTVVDAKNFSRTAQYEAEPAKQVAFADKIFISKHSLVDDTTYEQVLEEVRAINAFAQIQDLDEKPITLKDMFDLQLFYATEQKILQMEQNAREEEEVCEVCGHHHDDEHHHDHCHCDHHHTCAEAGCDCDHDHDCSKEDCGCTHHHTCEDVPCDCDHHHDCEKEHCDCGDDCHCHEDECHCHDEHEHHHKHHHHHKHSHHSGINSYVFETEKPLQLDAINEWLNELVYTFGEELYRYKGILNVEGIDYQIIFQGVQMSFDISRGRDWNDTPRKSTFVFIGKNLPEKELRDGFHKTTEK